MIMNRQRFQQAIEQFDLVNQQDPNIEVYQEAEYPKELLYSMRTTTWLNKLDPKASEALQLAARSQHICRWTIARDSYPMDRKGYLQWRTALKKFHAQKAANILGECGYENDTIERVKSLIQKQRLKTDPESQALEDVVCLVFLEFYFEEFAAKHQSEKVIEIVRKTWKKMSSKGRQLAGSINLNQQSRDLIALAVGK